MAKRTNVQRARSTGRESVRIGIIGGSGLYAMPDLTDLHELRIRTPFGDPSEAFVIGSLQGRRVAFLARHGRGHRILPSEINYRANIYALKLLGVERILSVSAVGSLREELRPLEFLIPDQFFDRTYRRIATFFGEGLVAHVSFDRPTCPELSSLVAETCDRVKVSVHSGGVYVCMEGPQFSTLAESQSYRQMGFDVIGMTNLTEAKLAREAEICYSTIAMITDYDCWHPDHASVTGEMIVQNLILNIGNAQKVIRAAVASIPEERSCRCGASLAHALITERALIPAATKKRLAAIIGRYIT